MRIDRCTPPGPGRRMKYTHRLLYPLYGKAERSVSEHSVGGLSRVCAPCSRLVGRPVAPCVLTPYSLVHEARVLEGGVRA